MCESSCDHCEYLINRGDAQEFTGSVFELDGGFREVGEKDSSITKACLAINKRADLLTPQRVEAVCKGNYKDCDAYKVTQDNPGEIGAEASP